ncbi:MAGa7180 family putative nuclease [Metamycoplasma spumans]|uniref:MAGa7180 family putative nuclease n=1 Tax=Metamycoplasma spumans TaxID=92406 RepID=UPI0034DDAC50
MSNKILIPKRQYFNKTHYTLDFENKVFIVNEDLLKIRQSNKPGTFNGFRKMTGSALGDIMGLGSFKSQFAAYARLCGFGMPVLDTKYIDAGVILEPKILDIVKKSLKRDLQTYPAKKYNYDYFKNNELFGGLPDGYCSDLNLVIEIKTAGRKKYDQWLEYGVDPSYIKQAQLYTYLMGSEKFSIVACFLEEDDYANPEAVDITKRIIKNWNFTINQEQVLDDIKFCTEWFEKYTNLGISPVWNDLIDGDLIEFLKCENQDQWEKLYLKWVEDKKAVPKVS